LEEKKVEEEKRIIKGEVKQKMTKEKRWRKKSRKNRRERKKEGGMIKNARSTYEEIRKRMIIFL
jgi:hypothetical protein